MSHSTTTRATGQPAHLCALECAVPAHVLEQSKVRDFAEQIFGDLPRGMLSAFDHTGIETRYSCVPLDWYGVPHDWAERNRLFIEHALDLLEDLAERTLTAAGLEPCDIDALITVSSTGIATPTLDALLINRLAFRPDVERLPIFGLGCAGGVLGLGRAAARAQARPGDRVLVLVVELCGLTFRRSDISKSNVIATALFGDGAIGAVLCTEPPAPADAQAPNMTVESWGEHCWPGTLDVMGWLVENDGLGVLFSRDIPTVIRQKLAPALDAYLDREGLNRRDIDLFLPHPGGAKVITALEDIWDLESGGLTHSRATLRDFGNMSAPTALFALKRALGREPPGRWLLAALGPGFTAGFCTLAPRGAPGRAAI